MPLRGPGWAGSQQSQAHLWPVCKESESSYVQVWHWQRRWKCLAFFSLCTQEEDSQWLIRDLRLLKLYCWDSCPWKHKSVSITILFHDVSLTKVKIGIALIKLSYVDCCVLIYIKRHLCIILCSMSWFSSYWDTEIFVFWTEMLWNFLWVHEKIQNFNFCLNWERKHGLKQISHENKIVLSVHL